MTVLAPQEVIVEATKPYSDQKPGTSGLRKKVARFQEPCYLANFVQSVFNVVPEGSKVGQTWLVSGDGRFWTQEAVHVIAEIAAANGVSRLWVGRNGWVSTPAASCIIRQREGGCCKGGLLLTASHNPGGPREDFGIKFNCDNGGPAPESVTDAIYENTTHISEVRRVKLPPLNLAELGVIQCTPSFKVEVIDPVEDWFVLMKSLFDFTMIRELLHNPEFTFVYDGLNGIAGPYARRLFVDEFGCPAEKCLQQCVPLPDFGGHHPDPNLTYAERLVEQMCFGCSDPEKLTRAPDFGAAGDGDNDRNMILGRGWFVTPSDSVALIAHYATRAIPYFREKGLKGVARSMPTSQALKAVAEALKIPHFEVPTGWKFFGNLMDAGKCSLCGEESFGTGSDHIREKDGLWAVLCWLSILALEAREQARVVSVREINEKFWATYGRYYYTRYDYEGVKCEAAQNFTAFLESLGNPDKRAAAIGSMDDSEAAGYFATHTLSDVNVFEYHDPVDSSISKNQGIRVVFADGSRFVIRLSGTGSTGATIRLYLEMYSRDHEGSAADVMKPFIHAALKLCNIKHFIGTEEPTVKT